MGKATGDHEPANGKEGIYSAYRGGGGCFSGEGAFETQEDIGWRRIPVRGSGWALAGVSGQKKKYDERKEEVSRHTTPLWYKLHAVVNIRAGLVVEMKMKTAKEYEVNYREGLRKKRPAQHP